MKSSSRAKSVPVNRLPGGVWLGMALLALAFFYLWILPLFLPRGDFLWGYYRLKDLLLGIPIALATLFALAVLISPAKYRRPLSIRLSIVFTSVVLMLFLCDLIYAFLVIGALRPNFWLDQKHIPRKYSTTDSELGFVRKPGVQWFGHIQDAGRTVVYQTDENGFRNPGGMTRADIVFLGDSFTEAAQVSSENTFAQLVSKTSGLVGVNLGRGAYGPQQEQIVLQRYGLGYQPRFVVWQLFEGNDLLDAELFASWKRNPEQNISFLERYFNNSFLAGLFARTRLRDRGIPQVSLRYHDGTAQRIRIRYRYLPGEPDEIPVGLWETRRVITEGQRLCDERGIKLIILFVPTMVRVQEPYLTFDRFEDQVYYLPSERDTKKNLSTRISEICSEVGCTFVDAFPGLQQAAAGDNRYLYIPNDEHLDIKGHEVIARTLLPWLAAKNSASLRAGSNR